MNSCFGKTEILTGFDGMFFSFVANHALAIQHEDERFARSGVFGQFGARIKGHDTAGWTEAEFDAQIENTRSQITELREKISDAIIYISKRTELTFAPLKLNRVAISLYDIVKSTGERKDAFRFTYQAEGCTKGRLYKCLSHSERLRAGMEVSEMVKRLTGRNYPVFADDMESIEDLSNVKPTGQVIMARVVPHAPLSVQPLQPIQASAQAQAA